MARISNTQRTLARLRKLGWEAAVVERWVPIPQSPIGGVRRDLGGFGDVLAWGPLVWEPSVIEGWLQKNHGGILAVQACSGSTLAAHRAKLRSEPRLRSWLEAGGRCEIWAWRKTSFVKKDGKKGRRKDWNVLIEPITLEHFSNGAGTGTGGLRANHSAASEPDPAPIP